MTTLSARRRIAKARTTRRLASARRSQAATAKTTFAIIATKWLQIPNGQSEEFAKFDLPSALANLPLPSSPTALPPNFDMWAISPKVIAMPSRQAALEEVAERNAAMFAKCGPKAPQRYWRNCYMFREWFVAVEITEGSESEELFLDAKHGQLVSHRELRVKAIDR